MRIVRIILSCVTVISFYCHAVTVSSLPGVAEQLKHSTHTEMYQEKMTGELAADRFGRLVPSDKAFHRVQKWLIKRGGYPIYLGIKKWPYSRNSYIGIACASHKLVSKPTYNSRDCDLSKDIVTLRMLRKQKNGSFYPFTERFQWDTSSLVNRDVVPELAPELRGFDFSPYHISKTQTAFGIRSAVFVGYAQGGAVTETLTLFAPFKGKIKPILSQPISYYQNLSGQWHRDNGTRDHDIFEEIRVVIMQDDVSHGLRKLRIQSTSSRSSITYFWNPRRDQYIEER